VRLRNLERRVGIVVVGLLALLLAAGCRSHRERDDAKVGPDVLYKRAQDAVAGQDFANAIKRLEALESRFPFSEQARQARLDLIYVYYRNDAIEQAADAADTFIRENPTSPRADYAYYMKGLMYFAHQPNFIERRFKVDLSERPPTDARKSFDAFQDVIKRYPHSEYVVDSRLRMIYLRNRLANYELSVARYYMKRGAYVGALNRAKFCIENYDGAPAVQPALQILAAAYRELKMDDLAANAEKVYQANYSANNDAPAKKHWWNFF
jgi:outer membrane protein assembly factor BamD